MRGRGDRDPVSALAAAVGRAVVRSVRADGDGRERDAAGGDGVRGGAVGVERALAPGDVGAKVALLQQRLAWLGYPISASNIERQRFGQSTRNALRSFQSKNWLTPSGRADRATWRRLSRYAEPLGILPLRCTEVAAAICVDKTTAIYLQEGTSISITSGTASALTFSISYEDIS